MGCVLIGTVIWDRLWDVPLGVLRLMGRLMGWHRMEFHPREVSYDVASSYRPMSGPTGPPRMSHGWHVLSHGSATARPMSHPIYRLLSISHSMGRPMGPPWDETLPMDCPTSHLMRH